MNGFKMSGESISKNFKLLILQCLTICVCNEICFKISPWHCWCWDPLWIWGWPQSSNQMSRGVRHFLLRLRIPVLWNMLQNQFLALLMLGFPMGMGMAPGSGSKIHLWWSTLISVKNWGVGWLKGCLHGLGDVGDPHGDGDWGWSQSSSQMSRGSGKIFKW